MSLKHGFPGSSPGCGAILNNRIDNKSINPFLYTKTKRLTPSFRIRKASDEDKEFLIQYINKNIRRKSKEDLEGNYRLISLLWESLEDYCLLRDKFYFSGKKIVRYIKEEDKIGYEFLSKALINRTNELIISWLNYIINI